MFIQITRIPKRPTTKLALEWFIPCVCPYMNFQPVLPRVALPAIQADVTLLRFPQAAHQGLYVSFVTIRRRVDLQFGFERHG